MQTSYPLVENVSVPPPFPTDREIEPPPPPRVLTRRAQEVVRRAMRRVVDSGLPGLHPLRVHLVLCGFPRSGTTMLQAMVQTSYAGCRTYPVETSGYFIAQIGIRNHPYLVTKRPNDIFWVPRIFEWYAGRRAEARVVMLRRDPRAVLTSRYKGRPGYYISPKVWYAYYRHYVHLQSDPRILAIAYEDLVRTPDAIQERISAYTGMTPVRPFGEFHRYVDQALHGVTQDALNGVRPPDPASIDRWRRDEHADRIRWLLKEMPDLPDMLVQLEYEEDDDWVARYR